MNTNLVDGLMLAASAWVGGGVLLHLVERGVTADWVAVYVICAAICVWMLCRLQSRGN